jgi:hypothetical protein
LDKTVPSQALHFFGYAFEKSQALQKCDFIRKFANFVCYQKLKFPNNSITVHEKKTPRKGCGCGIYVMRLLKRGE